VDVNFNEVIQATGAQVLGQIDGNLEVLEICTDSRALDKADLFFALVGKNFNGHDFIKEAIEKKVRAFVVSETEKITPEFKKSAAFFVVEDTLKAYGDLAKYYRQKFKIPAVAITGS
jgi:UDP-N-acetylmuramoyl-tripeptide--D-alanyl-D-alanine ligase